MGTSSGSASIRIHNRYKWHLDPRMGTITIYVDGRKVGRVELDDSLEIAVAGGDEHIVRARLWYLFSPGIRVRVGNGDTKNLYVDVRRNLSPLQLVLMTFKPFVALYLGDSPNQ